MSNSIGARIAAARIEKSLSVSEVAQQVRIRNSVLQGIERDDYSLCGGEVYARGHIRNICAIVGLNADELLKELVPEVSDLKSNIDSIVEPKSRDTDKQRRFLMVAAGVAVIALTSFALLRNSGQTPSQPLASKSVVESSSAQPTTESSQAVATFTSGVNVKVNSDKASTWLAVTNAAGTQLFSGILPKGQIKTFSDEMRLHLVIGNAGGVTLTVNGKDLGRPGELGRVLHFDFVPGDPTKA